ncbi:Tll0287-like domain-containing protein [Pseudoalteromonas spongiae]|uniref:Tll0287-like domain-containing protein n=1 Tax=Pseudoalteromonas spongiae TaxID=298657 RepID=UPI0037365050
MTETKRSTIQTVINASVIPLIVFAGAVHANDAIAQKAQLDVQAKKITNAFATELKTTLMTAVAKGGLSAGVEVCQEQAPEIAKKYSSHGWQISRTSLKTRNSQNTPNIDEIAILQDFAKRLASGEPAKTVFYSNLNPQSGEYQFMKAIPTGQVCLACHGENISDDLQTKIKAHYPNDNATGFKLGELRGAFKVYFDASNAQ